MLIVIFTMDPSLIQPKTKVNKQQLVSATKTDD